MSKSDVNEVSSVLIAMLVLLLVMMYPATGLLVAVSVMILDEFWAQRPRDLKVRVQRLVTGLENLFDPDVEKTPTPAKKTQRKDPTSRIYWITAGVWGGFAVIAVGFVTYFLVKVNPPDSGTAILLFIGIIGLNGLLLALNVYAHQHRWNNRSLQSLCDILPATNGLVTLGLTAYWYVAQIGVP